MEQISELQKKRAVNLIWNSAGSYDFIPDFKAYDSNGMADVYWNCIIGAVRKHYDYPQLEDVFRGIKQYEDADIYEALLWLGLENCVYQKEFVERPVLEALRKKYAESFVRGYQNTCDFNLAEALEYAHYLKVAGFEPKLNGYDMQLLNELEFSPDMTTEEVVSRAKELLQKWFQISAELKKKHKRDIITPALRKIGKKNESVRVRKFGIGFADHPDNIYGGSQVGEKNEDTELKTKMSAAELRSFMETKYGKPVFTPQKLMEIERTLCTGNHSFCHLHFTQGDKGTLKGIQNGFEALQRQKESVQVANNRRYYMDNLAQNRTAIDKLTGKIQNSVLLHLRPAEVKANSGLINAATVWRALKLNDDKVFIRNEQNDIGELSVDILLDASTSQKNRQEIVSCQGYMIAESMKRCSIPCRVMSFCSMTGYTIMRIFKDYSQNYGNDRIFEYVSNGCNRDGLAISAAHYLINQSGFEHKILIILSDVKPNDVVKITGNDGALTPYEQYAGIRDTALEVRKARADGISVICVFTGSDEDIPSAKTVYGRDFAKIQSMDKLADTVGILIQNQIKNL